MKDNELIKNRRRRIFMSGLRKTMIITRNVIIAILLAAILFTAILYSDHRLDTNDEIKMLSDAGLCNLVPVGNDRYVNVALCGNVKSKHTVVTVSDIGVQDFSVYTKYMSEIQKHARIALIDRAGYGLSSDTKSDQNVENIIYDYRTALKNANISGPYILLAHEFGGVYATYWANKYPDEVEAVIYLDGTEMIASKTVENDKISMLDRIKNVAYKIGFQRITYQDIYAPSSKVLNQQDASYSKALNMYSVCTNAQLSELSLMCNNYNIALNLMQKNNIPKLYISSSNSFTEREDVVEYFNYKNEQYNEMRSDKFYDFNKDENVISKDIDNFINNCKNEYDKNTKTFVDAVGNCQLTRIPGDSKIYEQKPQAVENAIVDFLLYLNGEKQSVEEYYEVDDINYWKDKENGTIIK